MHYYMNRLGFINFWDFEKEEIYFNKGNALVRGENGSGKSIVLQSAIVYLLDGNMRANRLDPSGTTSRQMSYYLLGDDESVTESTGYLYLEFYHPEKKDYITIGTGLRARRNSGVDFWGFILKDGRRVERDIHLYKKEEEYNIPLDKKECRSLVKQDSNDFFTERQQEYEKNVNQTLFQMTDRKYKDLLNFLIEIRKPIAGADSKKGLKYIYEKLNTSLPVMKEEDLNALTISIRSMDELSSTIENLKKEKNALASLKKVYEDYHRSVLYAKKKKADQIILDRDKLNEEKNTAQNDLENEKKKLSKIEEDLLLVRKSLEETNAKLYSLKHDGNYDEIQRIQKEIQRQDEKIKEIKNAIENHKDEIINLEEKKKIQEDLLYQSEKSCKEYWMDADEAAWDLDLPFHQEYEESNISSEVIASFSEQGKLTKKRMEECLMLIREKEKQESSMEYGKGMIIRAQKEIDRYKKKAEQEEENYEDQKRAFVRELAEYASLCQVYDIGSHIFKIQDTIKREEWKKLDQILFQIFLEINNRYVERNGYVKAGAEQSDIKEVDKNLAKLEILKDEYCNIISRENLMKKKQGLDILQAEMKKEYEFMDRLEESQSEIESSYREISKKVQTVISGYGFMYQIKSQKYEILSERMDEYLYALEEAAKCIQGKNDAEYMISDLGNRIEETEQTLDDLRYQMQEISRDREVTESHLQAMNIEIEPKEAMEITRKAEEYRTVVARLQAESKLLKEKIIPDISEKVKKLSSDIQWKEKQEKVILDYLEKELKHFPGLKIYDVGETEEMSEKLINLYRDHEAMLMSYQPELKRNTTNNVLELKFCDTDTVDEMFASLQTELQNKGDLLEKQETNLYEKILLDTVSQKMMYKIRQSKEWVEKISERMVNLKTTSGMIFNLKWLPKKAEDLEKISTENLVDILSKNVDGNVSEEELDMIKKHFTLRLKQEKEKAIEQGMEVDYDDIIHRCFDYRTWYEFKMYITEPRQKEKELSNKRFMSLSGGERATAIYSSLLSALNALYSECEKEDHPRFMGLDEAFTVCDSANTDAVFDFIAQMDLEYLLNSQTLWGTYPSVKNLAISHLTHDKNSGTVAVSRFSWNGVERRAIFSEI